MKFEIDEFVRDLDYHLNIFDLNKAKLQCDLFVDFLMQSNESFPLEKAERVLKMLRKKRMFELMQKVADILLQTGRISFAIQNQYAQSLVDTGNYTAAIYVLNDLVEKTALAPPSDTNALLENCNAKGLIGRVYKQLYVNANNTTNPQCIRYLSLAATAYYGVYSADDTKHWHGINTVALLERARRDKVEISLKLDSLQLAKEILSRIQTKYNENTAVAWDFAIAAEACVALDKPNEAIKWLSGYARMPDTDAFALASTLRQLEEVWQLNLTVEMGQWLLPVLRSELIKSQGGGLILDIEDIKKQQEIENSVDSKYRSLMEKKTAAATTEEKVKLEKVFGHDTFQTYKWYMTGAARCLAVARIGKDSSRGIGTGFLIKGKDLKETLGEELVLLTNAHVVSNNPTEQALRPEQAIVIFEALNRHEEFRDLEIIWSSPINELDAALLRFSKADEDRLKTLTKDLQLYPISRHLPPVETPPTQKVYVIGHPFGGTLQISFQDNLLIDHDKNAIIHYRTPTEGGSSGSPVFNDQWDLIGLHHAGSKEMPCLNGKPGSYEANEGIWIQAIKSKLLGEALV